jgi:hypothetical protein
LRDIALVECIRTTIRDRLQRQRQIRLAKPVTGLQRRPVGVQENPRGGRVTPQNSGAAGQDVGIGRGQHEPFASQPDRRRHDGAPRHRPVFRQRGVEPKNRTRNTHRLPAVQAATRYRLAIGAEVHVPCGSGRRGFPEIDEHIAAVGQVRGKKPAAADIAAAGINDSLGVAHRNRGIDRVAALTEDFGTRLGSQPLSGDDQASGGFGGRKGSGLHRQDHTDLQKR